MARDRGGPKLVHHVMLYPVIERNFNSKSYQDNGSGYLLSKGMMAWFWDLYQRTPADASHPYMAPIKAADLRGIAPALVVTAEFDPLRDEGEAYAKRLQQAGVPTVCKRYDGMIHGFFGMVGVMDKSTDAMQLVATTLKKAYGTQQAVPIKTA
jgi:acetyl esterase